MVELVDTQVSGICARKGVGVRIPPFALYSLSLILMLSTLSSCGKSSEQDKFSNPALQEKAASRTNEISTGALNILEQHVGNQEEAIAALRKYIAQNREEVLGLRRYFDTARKRMKPEDLVSFEEKMKEDREGLHTRAETLLRTFDDHMAVRRVLKLVY